MVTGDAARVGTPSATRRDLASNALVLGVAGFAWFGWAQEGPPAGWEIPLLVGSVLGALLAAGAVVRLVRGPADGSAMADPAGRRRYGWAVLAEVVAIVAGVVLLGALGRGDDISAWILLVVGTHFWPLATLFRIPSLRVAGALLVLVALLAAVLGAVSPVLPSAVSGAAGGLVLVVFGALSLRDAHQLAPSGEPATEK
ncbi:MAG TPA: hypothetical protein VFL99_08265 [Segeticoccus sp.]|uniref:hypothetical protein n=1 Tax=Segeticoccus sp. TaxID=2706531 RepID=UPI002D7FECC5|nr:hypothetical protein [Segeticoccus sp.]HET8600305.1 hypothetical protein [Segeticoccus sp.]